MNLKEAFRFQNKLTELTNLASAMLSLPGSTVRTQTTYLRKKAMPEAEDEVLVNESTAFCAGRINEMLDFLMFLLEERAALGKAIRAAKAGMELDLDLEAGLNKQRQSLAAVFRTMAAIRPSETLERGGGVGYCFNAEGNQVTYRCDVEKVTTIDFDRDQVRRLSAKLFRQADEISTRIDVALVTTQVDYRPPFDVNDNVEIVFEQFCQARKSV